MTVLLNTGAADFRGWMETLGNAVHVHNKAKSVVCRRETRRCRSLAGIRLTYSDVNNHSGSKRSEKLCENDAVTWKTVSSESQNVSKLLRSLSWSCMTTKLNLPPNSCMPSSAKMTTNENTPGLTQPPTLGGREDDDEEEEKQQEAGDRSHRVEQRCHQVT